MGAWLPFALQMLAALLPIITAVIQAIQANGGNPTPAQASELATLMKIKSVLDGALNEHAAAALKDQA